VIRGLSLHSYLAALSIFLCTASCSTTPSEAEDTTTAPEEDVSTSFCNEPYGCCSGGNLSNCSSAQYCGENGCEEQCVVVSCSYGKICEFNLHPAGQPCILDDLCIWNTACDARGVCAGAPADCNDNNPCTTDSCDPATGQCVNAVQGGASCDDGNPCTTRDDCNEDGICTPGPKMDCTEAGVEANDCIDHECDADTGECTIEVVRDEGEDCIDGDSCTWNDTCDADGGCAGSPHDCGKIFPDPCKTGICNESKPDDGSDGASACLPKWLKEGTSCPDGDGIKCTVSDKCVPVPDGNGARECEGSLIECDDGNPCTDAYCDPDAG
jgi:hypothetical protein